MPMKFGWSMFWAFLAFWVLVPSLGDPHKTLQEPELGSIGLSEPAPRPESETDTLSRMVPEEWIRL